MPTLIERLDETAASEDPDDTWLDFNGHDARKVLALYKVAIRLGQMVLADDYDPATRQDVLDATKAAVAAFEE